MTTKGVSLVASTDAVTFFSDGNQPREYNCFIQNRSDSTVQIRAALRKGSNECFKLTAGANETAIAIGLKKIVTILYTPPTDTFIDFKKDSSNFRDVADDLGKSGTIDIYAEDKLFLSIPVEVRPPVPHLVVSPTSIDYGRVVAEGQVEWKKFTLTNDGAVTGPFVLKPNSPLVELSIYNGTIAPTEVIDIKVGLQCSGEDGAYEGIIKICSSEEDESMACSVTLLATMQSRQLQLLDVTGSSPVTCISFGAVYYGMEVSQQALLFNNCPEHTSFVIVLNEQAAGTEVGVDKTDTISQACTQNGLGPTKWKEQGTASSPSSILEVTPIEGVFTPYGKRIVQFQLHPTFYQSRHGWAHHQGLPARRDYALFVKIMPVSGLESSKTESGAHVEVAVSATVLPVELNILPKNCLTFGSCVIGKHIKQKCSIVNASRSLPVHFVIKQIAHYKISCQKGKIGPGAKQDVEVVFKPRQIGTLNSQFCVNVMAIGPSSTKPDSVIYSTCLKVIGTGTSAVIKEQSLKSLPYALSGDRAASIRPHDRRQLIKTPFTKIPRYTYTDPDYTLTPEEEAEKRKNQQTYIDYINQLRKDRIRAEKDKLHSLPEYRNSTDIDIKPSQGIKPKMLTVKEQQATGLEQPIKEQSTVYTTTQLQEELDDSLLTFVENPPMKATDPKIIQECQRCLVPMHQAQVRVEPDKLQFGDVILNVDAVRVIVVKNHSPKHVHVKFKFEYSQVSCVWVPLQSEVNIILPSQTYTNMPLLFIDNKLGMFDKNISYTVNGHHHYRIPVRANVVEMSVSLSTNELMLTEPLISPINFGFYGSVKLTNQYEVPASFSWKLSEEENTAFYPQHSSGIIPANSTLECEFIHHPAYNHSDSATFNLLLDGGKNETIKCIAEYKKPICQFADQRLSLGYVPLNLITIRRAVIINSSKHHAYYKVVDVNPHLGVTILPKLGCVPASGRFELTLQLKPQVVEKLEFDLSVKFRAGNTITTRVGASVEPPLITIDKEAFRFGGVYCKSTTSTPFKLVNKGNTRAHLIFDLSYFTDFSITLPDHDDPYAEVEPMFEGYDTPGIFCYNLQANKVVECILHFTPQDVAAYDFILPILINGYKAPTPPPSPWPPSNDPYRSSIAPNISHHVPTPARRVLATVLKPLIDVSISDLTFEFSASDLDEGGTKTQSIKLCNKNNEDTSWSIIFAERTNSHNDIFKFITLSGQPIALDNEYKLEVGKECELVILCCPTKQGTYSSAFQLIVNGNKARPYRHVKLMANVPSGIISCEPAELAMIPAPLNSPVSAIFVLVVQGFLKTVKLEVAIPTLEDGVMLVVDFVDSHIIEDCSSNAKHISCSMTFMATKPISVSNYIVITDSISGKRKECPFSVTADNSILTVYNFLAQHMADFELIYHNNLTPMLVPSVALQPPPSSSSESSLIMEQSSFLVSSQFDDMFVQDVVAAVCRWLSVFGWSNRLHHFSAPEILRRGWDNDNSSGHQMKKQVKSGRPPKSLLLEMITHLCGRLPPGISVLMPPCKNDSERVKAHYTAASILLTFIKSQGGLLWSLKPEALLDYKDFLMWCSENTSTYSNLPEEFFDIISKQSWTHLLMQIIKVLVLPTVESSISKTLRHKIKDLDACTSNIYGIPECMLLTWLNHHYEEQYPVLFPDSELSEQRYIKSFEVDLMDSIVLACVMIAYTPYLVSIYFQELYPFPTSAEQCSHNAIILIKAMRHIGLDYDIQTTDITSPNPVTMLLLCCYLYKNLPQYKPTATLSFEAAMNATVVQNIKLDNPSAKSLVYSAIIVGPHSGVFFTANTSSTDVTIAGKSSRTIDVHFCGNAISDFEATLFLVGRLGGIACGTTLAFSLRGSVTGAKPEVNVEVNAPLYELQHIPLTVSNPFSQPATFQIGLFEQPGSVPFQKYSPDKLKEKRRVAKGDQKKMIVTSNIKKEAKDNLQLFNSVKSTVRLRSSESIVLDIKYVPIILAKRYCIVTLSCKDIGETIYTIQVTATLPRPLFPFSSLINARTLCSNDTKTLYLKTNAEELVKEELIIPSVNPSMEAALLELTKWRMSEAEYNRRKATGMLSYAALTMAIGQLELTNVPATYNDKTTVVTTTEYNVEYDSTAEFSLPSSLQVSTDAKSSAVLPLEFRSEVPGQYECHITLHSKYDVRVYIIEATVLEKGRYATLEFNTRATEPITQQIPIVNPSSVDWNLRVALNGTWFTGPKSFIAKAIATTDYPLTFSPIKPGGWEGELELLNTNDGSKHIFKLIGKAKRALAQGHIVLKGQVKKSFVHKFHVPNHGDKTVIFQVESDISFISGPPTITVGPGETTEYEATIAPLYQGMITGVLSFTAVYMSSKSQSFTAIKDQNSGCQRVWFTVELQVKPAPPDYTLTLVSPTLSATNVHLKIDSPHFEPLQLEVLVEGHGLSGPDKLSVESGGEETCVITYSPTLVGETTGRVVFTGSPDGEFWYHLTLTAQDPEPVVMDMMECPLGCTITNPITLVNPHTNPITVTITTVNPQHFALAQDVKQLMIKPDSSLEVPVIFKPSKFGYQHEGEIIFTSKELGRQVFKFKGNGLYPTVMPVVNTTSALTCSTVTILSFPNPLDHTEHFNIEMHGKDVEHFCLLLKQTTGILLNPGVTLDIPISFSPEVMKRHECHLTVSVDTTSQPLKWHYPIIGQPHLRPFSATSGPLLRCRAKERLEQRLEVSLVGSENSTAVKLRPVTPTKSITTPTINTDSLIQDAHDETYTYHLSCNDTEFGFLVEQCLGIRLIRKSVDPETNNPILLFHIIFVPSKVIRCTVELEVRGITGGVWIFPITMDVLESKPDDVIVIEAQGLNKETTVGFRLTSMEKYPVPFTAHIVSATNEFSVHPSTGELPAIGSQGSLICVSYKPVVYGKNHSAKVIIQSPNNTWNYEIIGKSSYSTPRSGASTYKLTTPTKIMHRETNFIRKNIRNSLTPSTIKLHNLQ